MDFPYEIPLPVALAVIAVLGYLTGRTSRAQALNEADKARRELRRAKSVAKELEQIAEGVRKQLSSHHMSVARFKDRVTELSGQEKETAWTELCREAEQILKPTLRLAEQISRAYDEIRQQTNHLMSFTEVRTDPLTRVSNRRGLDESLESMFAHLDRYGQPFSLALFRHRPLQAGERHQRPPARRPHAAGRGPDTRRLGARHGRRGPLRRRGVCGGHVAHHAGKRLPVRRSRADAGREQRGTDDQRRSGPGSTATTRKPCYRVPTRRFTAARRPVATGSTSIPAAKSSRLVSATNWHPRLPNGPVPFEPWPRCGRYRLIRNCVRVCAGGTPGLAVLCQLGACVAAFDEGHTNP